MKWRLPLVIAAVAAALVPLPPAAVERVYADRFYLALQLRVTGASNLVPFALLDVLVAVLATAWVGGIVVDSRRRRGRWPTIRRAIGRTVVWTAALYLLFLAMWGLNYRRVPLKDKLQFDPGAISPDTARVLIVTAIDEVNALHDRVQAERWPSDGEIDEPLGRAFARAQRDLGLTGLARPGRPKWTVLDAYFRRAGVAALTDPYFLETLVSSDLLPFERPFVIAHEWGHLAGFADEGEANFVGWLTCLRGSASDRYSGWLFVYSEIVAAIPERVRAELAMRLASGPRDDLRAIALRLRLHVSPAVSAAGWQAYDRYLKANRVEAGTASYATVVRLMLGTRFGPDWRPLLRRE